MQNLEAGGKHFGIGCPLSGYLPPAPEAQKHWLFPQRLKSRQIIADRFQDSEGS